MKWHLNTCNTQTCDDKNNWMLKHLIICQILSAVQTDLLKKWREIRRKKKTTTSLKMVIFCFCVWV